MNPMAPMIVQRMQLVKMRVVRTITADGMVELHPHLLGRELLVDLLTMHSEHWHNSKHGRDHIKKVVADIDGGLMPWELLDGPVLEGIGVRDGSEAVRNPEGSSGADTVGPHVGRRMGLPPAGDGESGPG